ncbi:MULTISPECIES: MOSC domain-containing protein [Halomicrobium]|uniref:MOSC domain containing protein n=2 Tax=Halomicrobium mukohataei TaxID=57705 RepID=C7NXN6_HALMD|nr:MULTISPECIES: MOSC N-terminal beta barrel domain-containing protein [Halomicrobium]ACV46474.1 MOSC domain containing protein [Halomicrobium mukohataei DSM 12286]QCD65020.1 MOSC domain-containing protein [Halomicrobium mukohataei]QFR19826.1 MOSC domain-containing protein [Halomicrobium sp. ZPS1]
MAQIQRLTVYPVKGLDGVTRREATVTPGGTLRHDREFALFDEAGDVLNGKRTARVHDVATEFDVERSELAVEFDEERERFALDEEPERASRWFSSMFDAEFTLERDRELGYVDRRDMGPSIVSTATLRTVASWFDDVTVAGARRRLRANVEVSGVPPFWEDRFVGADAPAFAVGSSGAGDTETGSGPTEGVRFEGVTPCGRCVVPERDPETGEPTPEFRERFVERREATFPDWADPDAFDHYYTVMLISRVPERDRGGRIRVGDEVSIVE